MTTEALAVPATEAEDRYHRTALDLMRLGDVTTAQLNHYLACRRRMEEHLDEETVFDVLTRLARQADEETTDAFARIANRKSCLRRACILAAATPDNGVVERTLARIAYGMLQDGWAESRVTYALGTLGDEEEAKAA